MWIVLYIWKQQQQHFNFQWPAPLSIYGVEAWLISVPTGLSWPKQFSVTSTQQAPKWKLILHLGLNQRNYDLAPKWKLSHLTIAHRGEGVCWVVLQYTLQYKLLCIVKVQLCCVQPPGLGMVSWYWVKGPWLDDHPCLSWSIWKILSETWYWFSQLGNTMKT